MTLRRTGRSKAELCCRATRPPLSSQKVEDGLVSWEPSQQRLFELLRLAVWIQRLTWKPPLVDEL